MNADTLARLTAKNPNACPKEEGEQETLAAWLDLHDIRWCHVANEGSKRANYHMKMKRAGLKKGVPDCLIFDPPPLYPDHVATAVELKRRKGGSLSPEQRFWLAELEIRRWKAACCKGAGEAIAWLESLGYGRRKP